MDAAPPSRAAPFILLCEGSYLQGTTGHALWKWEKETGANVGAIEKFADDLGGAENESRLCARNHESQNRG